MVRASLVFLLLSHAGGMRISQEAEELDVDAEIAEIDQSEGTFTCPPECVECCSKMTSLTGMVGSYYPARNRFKCITRTDDEVTSVAGYRCSNPHMRVSNAAQTKMTCHFTPEERHAGAWRTLHRCRDTHTRRFEEFVGPTACSSTNIGSAISHVTGAQFGVFAAADLVLFTASGAATLEARQLASDQILPPGMTRSALESQLRGRFRDDLEDKRLTSYVMGAYAAGMGALGQSNMTRATEQPRILDKVELPGWPARVITIESPEDDMKPISLAGGALPCAFSRFMGQPMEDNMEDGVNQWGAGPEELHEFFYDRFGTYQRPNHFIVPPHYEPNSNKITEQFVFQNVGAHRLELINSHDGHDAELISPLGLGACPVHGLPVVGCPYPLSSSLAALPHAVRRAAKFAVRLEGLFDDIPLRPGLAKWGSNAFFDGEGHIIALQYEGSTALAEEGGRDWEYFKFVFRSSLMNLITAFDHLVFTHILSAETLAIATAENLGPDNELRMLVNPHMQGSMKINLAAGLNLFPAGGFVHRSSPFTEAGYEGAPGRPNGIVWGKSAVLRYVKFDEVYRTYRRHFEELRSEGVQMPELPFFEDGFLIHQEIHRYVEDAIGLIYGNIGCNVRLLADHEAQRFISHFWALTDPATPDLWPTEFRRPTCNALTELLTEVIFCVSGWHRHVGLVADFYRDPRITSTVWKVGELNSRPAQSMLMKTLAQGTNAILPKFSHDLADTVYGDHEALAENFRTFHRRMLEIQEEIEQRNQVRQAHDNIPYHNMLPSEIEYGVAV